MRNLHKCKRLRPFCEFAYPAVYVLEADKRDKEENTAEDGEPKDGGDEIVEDKILNLTGARAPSRARALHLGYGQMRVNRISIIVFVVGDPVSARDLLRLGWKG